MSVSVKICGLSEPNSLTASIESGADFIGLVFYPPSPRNVDIECAKYLTSFIPKNVNVVGLFVNPDDTFLTNVLHEVPLTHIQLHGSETAIRVQEIKNKFKRPVIKSFPIETAQDLEAITPYEGTADWFLFDAKAEKLPGGNGIAFDWNILKDFTTQTPWMLAGGLNPENVSEALKIISPNAVDVSSGVETKTAGEKDSDKIRSFISAVKQA